MTEELTYMPVIQTRNKALVHGKISFLKNSLPTMRKPIPSSVLQEND